MNDNTTLWLASASPRRRELVKVMGLPFEVRAANVDETPLSNERPQLYVRRVSHDKAKTLANQLRTELPANGRGAVVIAADTIVVFEDEIFGKPADAPHAIRMLRRMRNTMHAAMSAVTAINVATGDTCFEFCESPVRMRDYSDEEIERYVASGNPMDKAGAYAIQHAEFAPVVNFDHCFASVMGMPLCHLRRALAGLGVAIAADVPHACQQMIAYNCPVHSLFAITAEPLARMPR